MPAMVDERSSILFVCTGNSARSLLAEAIANHEHGQRVQAFSAGSEPAGEPHPLTIQTLQKYGLSTDGVRSKSWDEFKDQSFDLVVTLCDGARQATCPDFPGEPRKVHWSLPDPTTDERPEDMFEAVYDALVEAIGLLIYSPFPDLTSRANEASRQLSQRFRPRVI